MVLERSNIFEIQINIQSRLNCSQTHFDLAYAPQSRYDVYSKAASMIGRSFEKTVRIYLTVVNAVFHEDLVDAMVP